MADLFNWPKCRLTRLVFFRARPVNRGTHEHPRMSKGYLQPLVIFYLFFIFGVTLCMQIYASPLIFIIIQRRNYKEKQFFCKFLAGVELAIFKSAAQCLIHWATAGSANLLLQKFIFNCQARSQGPRIFSRWQPLFRANSKCLRPVSIMLARATPQSPAMKRPLENLEPYNYPHRQTENVYHTKTSRELERLRSLHV